MTAESALDRIASALSIVVEMPWVVITVLGDSGAAVVVHGIEEPPHNGDPAAPTRWCREVAITGRPVLMQDARRRRGAADGNDGKASIGGYAGVPIIADDHVVIGTLAALGPQPRAWHDRDLAVLRAFADAASVILGTRRVQRRHIVLDLSTTETATGLLTRRGFFLAGDALIARAKETLAPGIVVAIELVGMQLIDDRVGDDAGDDVVRGAGDLLRTCLGDQAAIARLGAFELGAVVLGLSRDATTTVRERLAAELARFNAGREPGRQLGWRVGIVDIPAASRDDLAQLMVAAEKQRSSTHGAGARRMRYGEIVLPDGTG